MGNKYNKTYSDDLKQVLAYSKDQNIKRPIATPTWGTIFRAATEIVKEKTVQLKEDITRSINGAFDEHTNSLIRTANLIAEDPSIPEEKKINLIIHVTSLICAVIAAQPIPLADIFILTPIQVVMVTTMSKVMGNPLGKDKSKELVASVAAVVGWGVLAQQLLLAGYKTVIPFMGAITTIPLVYAATYGLGCAAKAVLEARRRDQAITQEEIKRIKEKAEIAAKNEKRDWSLGGIQKELEQLSKKSNEYDRYKKQLQEVERERRQLKSEKDELIEKYHSTVSAEEVDQVLNENYELKHQLDSIRPELEQLKSKSDLFLQKKQTIIKKRLGTCYPNIIISKKAYIYLVYLSEKKLNALERQLGLLQYDISKVKFRDSIASTRVREIGYDNDGRIYVTIQGNMINICCIGNKGSQNEDIRWVKENFK